MDEDDMYEINDHLSALATWFFQFIKGREAEIPREDWMKLATHFERLEALFAQEGTPVYPNPIKSRWLTGKDESRQGNRAPAEILYTAFIYLE